jgi:hypothetical protein
MNHIDEFIEQTVNKMSTMILSDAQALKLISWAVIRNRHPPIVQRCESYEGCNKPRKEFRESCLLWECEEHLAIPHGDSRHDCPLTERL